VLPLLIFSSSATFQSNRANLTLYLVLLRIGFAEPYSLPHAGELLPRLSTLT